MESSKNLVLPVTLTGTNYLLWSRTTKTALRSKGLWEHILTAEYKGKTVSKKGDSEEDIKTDEEKWEQDDQHVLNVLQSSLEPSILSAYSYCETAKELWDTLEGVFGNLSNLSRIFEVKKALNGLQQEGKSFKDLFGEFRGLWAEMDMLRPSTMDPKVLQERRDQDQVFGLLLTLNESFKDLIKHILRYDKLPSLNEVCMAIQKEEGSRSLFQGPSETAYYGRGPHGQGHGEGRGSYGDKKELFCVHCKAKGHVKDKCWTLYPHLRPKKFAQMGKEDDGFVRKSDLEALIQSISKLTKGKGLLAKGKTVSPKPIIVDSGASHNMISDHSLLKNLKPHSGKVCVANGDNVNIEGIGDLHILDGKTEALFLPKFTNNLLSVYKATSDLDCKVVFDSNGVEFQDSKSGIMIGEGRIKDGLYIVGSGRVDAAKEIGLSADFSPSRWHERFGHPQFKTLQLMVPNLTKELEGCEACILGKHSRSSFPDSSSSYDSCFDLVHTDVWSSPCSTRDQYKYFISFIDEKSKYTWVTLMSSKSQAYESFTRFHSYVSTQYGVKIKTLRSDNGGEFVNHQMKEFLEKHGIVHQTTCPYTPQQNGVAERKNRHLMEMTRTVLFARGVPKTFWGDAVMTSTYLINRLSTPNLNNKSPYEILNGEKPKIDHLRVFGCICYVHVPEGTRNKLEARSIKCVFLGYSSTQKGWKCYNPETKRMYVSRDVRFDEGSSYFNEKDWSKGEQLVQTTENQAERLKFILEGLRNPVDMDHTKSSSDEPVQEKLTRKGENVSQEAEEETQSLGVVDEEESVGGEESIEESPPALRRSTRIRREPIRYSPDHWKSTRVYFNNFVCKGESSTSIEKCIGCTEGLRYPPIGNDTSSLESRSHTPKITPYPIENYYTMDFLPEKHQCYLVELDNEEIPRSYEEAKEDPRWLEAMEEELESMRKNGTWEMIERPMDKKTVGCRWVYTIKRTSSGAIERYKARLVAKGYTQVYGEDYTDTFAPVAKLHSIRALLSVAINKSWGLWQMDVKNAFLQGDLEEEVYMDVPEGVLSSKGHQVCRLKKAIYGLKQSPRAWYQRLSKCLMDKGFLRSSADHSLFMEHGQEGTVAVLIYVDDIIITGDNTNGIDQTKKMLKEEFDIKDLGELKYFLGIEMIRSDEGMLICQRKYTLEILSETGKLGTKPAKTPIEDNYKEEVENEPWPDVKQYQRLVGKLIYLTITRPDICFAVNQVSKHMQAPTLHHWHMVERILRYLKMNPGKGIWFNNNQSTKLVGYSDADWAGDRIDRKSTTGYCTFIGGNLVTWRSKKQKVVSLSSAEAEYRAMKEVTKELIWLKELLKDLGIESDQPITLHCDNKAALHIASNPVFHERTKHIEVDCHFVREKVQDGTIHTTFVRSEEQYADIFTKATTSQISEYIHGKIGLRDPHQPILRGNVKNEDKHCLSSQLVC